jgi:acetylglutamate kinase
MLYLIKFGGSAISDGRDLSRICSEISEMKNNGASVIAVHGGGPEISRETERLGLKPVKINGVRVTDSEVLDAASRVLKKINGRVCGYMEEAGAIPEGMGAFECTLCRKMDPITYTENGTEKTADYGLVGEVVSVETEKLYGMLNSGKVPVIYPIGSDGKTKLNVNADTMAAGIAAGMKCDEMITVTDVPGVLRDVNDPSSKFGTLTKKEILALIEDGTVSGGMIPKVEACIKAVEAGAKAVRMVNGKDPDNIFSDVAGGKVKGTLITG